MKDPRLQSTMLEAMLPLVHTGQGNIGSMDSSVWKGMYSAMYEQGMLDNSFDVRQAYSPAFLKKVYPNTTP